MGGTPPKRRLLLSASSLYLILSPCLHCTPIIYINIIHRSKPWEEGQARTTKAPKCPLFNSLSNQSSRKYKKHLQWSKQPGKSKAFEAQYPAWVNTSSRLGPPLPPKRKIYKTVRPTGACKSTSGNSMLISKSP